MRCLECCHYEKSTYDKMGYCLAPSRAPNSGSIQNMLYRARLFIPGECWLPEELKRIAIEQSAQRRPPEK
jgi:hypothetical protein